ncbi:hypothetical protein JYU34_022162 [Plutella xylostella]|uniref:Cytadhesion n=1 Tax=Plutella xylostella TaxID=51655 RepID=A0ABQ7PU64_PLUXY|nr:hypothetical protein JYU34_022162 [Plutella xylostella]
MATLTPIPAEMLKLIPMFNGDKRLLNLFLRKCEYVIAKYRGNDTQNLYLYHSITSRLTDDAAALVSEREDVDTWSALKSLLVQHFGDPRSEECIAIELETLKLKANEPYTEFCNRIQTVRSILFSKVNELTDENTKRSKIAIYNNTALNVFLYSLPENMVRIVRLKGPDTLENALSIVLEEVNFHDQYNMRNKLLNNHHNLTSKSSQPITQPQNSSKFGTSAPGFVHNSFKPPFNNYQTPNFKFGIPNQNRMMLPQSNNVGYKPNFGYRPNLPQQTGYRPQFGVKPQFGIPNQNSFKPQQFGNRPQTNQQFGYKPNFNIPKNYTDVSMRTASAIKPAQQQTGGFRLNEVHMTDDPSPQGEQYEHVSDNQHEFQESYDYDYSMTNEYIQTDQHLNENTSTDEPVENFHILASDPIQK